MNNGRQYAAPPVAPYQGLQLAPAAANNGNGFQPQQLAPNPNGPAPAVPPRNRNQAGVQQYQYDAPPAGGYQQLQLAPGPNGPAAVGQGGVQQMQRNGQGGG